MPFTSKQIIESSLFKKTIKQLFQSNEYEIVERPASFSVRLKKEDSRIIKRIILLSPKGFTADKIDLLSPHPEARRARIRVLGKIKPQNKGFVPINKEIRFVYSLLREAPTEKDSSYSDCSKHSQKYYGTQLKSWKNWFYVVKESGWGNFHNLINTSNDWVVLLLEKELLDRKKTDIKKFLKQLPASKGKKLRSILKQIEIKGDKVFRDKQIVKDLLKIDHNILVSVLIRMLNFKETGKHEPCTFFAILLKIIKTNKKLVSEEVDRALKFKTAPYYYLQDLKKKILKLS